MDGVKVYREEQRRMRLEMPARVDKAVTIQIRLTSELIASLCLLSARLKGIHIPCLANQCFSLSLLTTLSKSLLILVVKFNN